MSRLLNLALYQLGWFACVLGAAYGFPYTGALVALGLTAAHVLLVRERSAEFRLVLASGALGVGVETVLLQLDVLELSGHPVGALLPPLWIVVLWVQFATLLHFALRWLRARRWLAPLFGFVGGPLAFLGGETLGAATFEDPRWSSIAVIAIAWGVALPLLTALSRIRSLEASSTYRPFEVSDLNSD